jgi:hypothetical protein
MGNENSTSVEAQESKLEKKLKEDKDDERDLAVVRRSQKNGNLQNTKGAQRYSNFGKRTMANTVFESVMQREDRYNPSIPIGWMKFKSDMIQTDLYEPVYFAGWKIILPKFMSWPQKRYILRRIYTEGPASVGFVVVGDALINEKILVTNRQVLTAL